MLRLMMARRVPLRPIHCLLPSVGLTKASYTAVSWVKQPPTDFSPTIICCSANFRQVVLRRVFIVMRSRIWVPLEKNQSLFNDLILDSSNLNS